MFFYKLNIYYSYVFYYISFEIPLDMFVFQGDDSQTTLNTYLVCQMFWSKGVIKSQNCCGDFNPQYNFINVISIFNVISHMSTSCHGDVIVIECMC